MSNHTKEPTQDEILLACGEMSVMEMRGAKAAVTWLYATRITELELLVRETEQQRDDWHQKAQIACDELSFVSERNSELQKNGRFCAGCSAALIPTPDKEKFLALIAEKDKCIAELEQTIQNNDELARQAILTERRVEREDTEKYRQQRDELEQRNAELVYALEKILSILIRQSTLLKPL